MFDYQFVKEGLGQWVLWADMLKEVPPIPKDAQFNSIIVPTVDTVRYTYLMDMLVKHEKPCLFVGPTGTGKSVYIQVKKTRILGYDTSIIDVQGDLDFQMKISKLPNLSLSLSVPPTHIGFLT